MKKVCISMCLLILVLFLVACGSVDDANLESQGFETGFLTLGVGYDARPKMDEFNLNGTHDPDEALMANWPVAVTEVDEKGVAIGETRVIETGAAEHPEKLLSHEFNAGYYRLEHFLPDEYLNKGKVEWVGSKSFESEIIKVLPNKNILNIKMVFCRGTGTEVAIFDYAKVCLPIRFPIDKLPSPKPSWKLLDKALNSSPVDQESFDIDNRNNNLVVAWSEGGIYAKRWDEGSKSWVQLGNMVSPSGRSPSLALDSSGYPVVAWSNNGIHVARWDGTAWVQAGAAVTTAADAAEPSLELDASNNPVVTWRENQHNVYVARLNGSTWARFGNAVTTRGGPRPSLALDGSGNPVLAFTEGVSISGVINHLDVFVKRWNGTAWISLGSGRLGVADASHVSLVYDYQGHFFVAWQESLFGWTTPEIYVKRWTGSSWVTAGGGAVSKTWYLGGLSLRLDKLGSPVVAFAENGYGYSNSTVKVTRLENNVWSQIGQPLDVDPSSLYSSVSLAINDSSNPVVAWSEGNTLSLNNLYVHRWE